MEEIDLRYTVMLINRNRKIIFDKLEYDALDSVHSYVLRDDSFVLCFFDSYNQIIPINSLNVNNPLTAKETYFYASEMHDLGWLYEEDFRREDTLLSFFLEV